METNIILASHGSMAEGTASAVRMIAGEQPKVRAYGLDTWETPVSIKAEVEAFLDTHPDERCVIVCDLKGGSVHNALMELCVRRNVAVICGMNLEIVLSLVFADDTNADEVRAILEDAKGNIEYFDYESFKNTAGEEVDELW